MNDQEKYNYYDPNYFFQILHESLERDTETQCKQCSQNCGVKYFSYLRAIPKYIDNCPFYESYYN